MLLPDVHARDYSFAHQVEVLNHPIHQDIPRQVSHDLVHVNRHPPVPSTSILSGTTRGSIKPHWRVQYSRTP